MLALSTSWRSTTTPDALALLQALERLPISGIELEYRISEAAFEQMRKPLKKSRLKYCLTTLNNPIRISG